MSPKEATIVAYCIDFVLHNGDHDVVETQLEEFASIKDLEFLRRKYEALSQTYNPDEE
jgi:uncharacterized ferredoxin-like protein